MAKTTNYSLLTLTPSDDEEKMLFWKFRIESLDSQFQIFTVIMTIAFLQSLANALYQQTLSHTWDTVNLGTVLLGQAIVVLISKRCK